MDTKTKRTKQDEAEGERLADMVAQPHNIKEKKKYYDYIGRKAQQPVHKRLCRFRNLVAMGCMAFY